LRGAGPQQISHPAFDAAKVGERASISSGVFQLLGRLNAQYSEFFLTEMNDNSLSIGGIKIDLSPDYA
jgi:hypothetical protein